MKENHQLEGLGGWLVLVGLGVVFSPLRLLILITQTYPELFADGMWALLTTEGSSSYTPYFAPFVIGEIIFNVGIFFLSTYIVYLFFTKKNSFPAFYILMLVASFVFLFLDTIIAGVVFPDEAVFDPETIKELTRGLFGVAVWIPYLLISKRVKATFVEPHNLSKETRLVFSICLLTLVAVISILIVDKPYDAIPQNNEAIFEPTDKDFNLDEILMDKASIINKNLPMMLDDETRFDSTAGINGQFVYKYTLVNYFAEDIDGKLFYESMQPQLINDVCATDEFKVFVDLHVPVKFSYYGKNTQKIISITIDSDACPNE